MERRYHERMLKKREKAAALQPVELPEIDQTELNAHVEELIRRGVARPPLAPLPDDFVERPPLDVGVSILELILEDRYSEHD